MTRIKKILQQVACMATAFLLSTANASTFLASTDLTFSASGSPNTISGTWFAQSLDVKPDEIVEYFKIEVLANSSTFGNIAALSFTSYFPSDSQSISFGGGCPLGYSCVGSPDVGSVSFLDVWSGNQAGARDFLFRLIDNDPRYRYTSGGPMNVDFYQGGTSATASGLVRVSAYGVASAVPEPETIALMLLGLTLLGLNSRRKGVQKA
jgi:hypothetical protein